MKKTFKGIIAGLIIFMLCFCSIYVKAADRYYYQLKVYHFKTPAQADRIEHYLQFAYIPAMHKLGVKNVGVFKTIDIDTTDRKIYVLTPFGTWNELENAPQKLLKDEQYLTAGKEYLDASYKDLPYNRIETIVLRAFPGMPEPAMPNLTASKPDRVYELRSYENPTEKYHVSKLKMFNEGGEITLFKKLNFNAVFYAEVLAGGRTPNLMYLTTYNSRPDRDAHWKLFNDAPEWKTLRSLDEYQNNVSHIDDIFLHPAAYSDY
jgi:hypothetical protein